MKAIKCPHCGHKVLAVIGVRWESNPYYYINRVKLTGMIWFWELDKIKPKAKKEFFRGFYCKFCYKTFPKKMEKEIFKYLKTRRLLRHLQGKVW